VPVAAVFSRTVALTLADPFAVALPIALTLPITLSVAERLKLGGRPERRSQ
jgi:hypothetical protein